MIVEYSDAAADQIRFIDAWWLANRDKNPDCFVDELDDAIAAILKAPYGIPVYDVVDGIEVRRYPMKKTRHHLYYRVLDDEQIVRVVSVSGSVKKDPPDLSSL